jgi:hypothetical protein
MVVAGMWIGFGDSQSKERHGEESEGVLG